MLTHGVSMPYWQASLRRWQAEPNLAAVEAWPRRPLVGPGARGCHAGGCRVHSEIKRHLRAAAAGWHVKLGAGSAEGPLQQAGGCASLLIPRYSSTR